MKKFLSRWVLYLVISIVVPIIFLVITAYFIHRNFRRVVIKNTQEQIATIADSAAKSITSTVLAVQSDLQVLALNPLIPKYIKEQENLSAIAQQWLFSIKNTLQKSNTAADAIYMLDAEGIVRSRIPFKKDWIGHSYKHKPSIKHCLETHQPCITEVTTDSGTSSIAISVPVFQKDKLIGILRTLVRFEHIGKLLGAIRLGDKGHGELVNTMSGKILYHPHEIKDFPQDSWKRFPDIFKKISTGKNGVGLYYSPQGDYRITAFSHINISLQPWVVLIAIPFSEINNPINKHAWNITILISIVIIVVVLGVTFFYRVHRKKEVLEQLHSFNQHVIASIPFAIMVVDKKFIVTSVNQTYRDIFKCSVGKFYTLDKRFTGILRQDKIPLGSQLGKMLSCIEQNKKAINEEIEIQGDTYSVSIVKMNLEETKWKFLEAQRYLITIEDITEKKALSLEIKKKEAEIIHSTRLASLGVMAAGIAHEINQPLAAIMNYSENISDLLEIEKINSPRIRSTIEKVVQQTRRTRDIIKHLRNFAHNGENRNYHNLSINEILEKVIKFLQPQLRLQQIKLYINIEESLPKIQGNALQLEQVFTNIICNAIDAIEKSEIKEIIVSARKDNQGIHIEITDSGCGFPSEIHQKIFDPFFTSKDPGKGTGLGLSITYRIIKEHGGDIIAENLNYRGAKFAIHFPLDI